MENSTRSVSIQEIQDTSGVRFGTSGARGLVADMTSEVCYAYASAFLGAIPQKSGGIAIAMDLRPSSPAIAAACAAAIHDSGLAIDFCGAVPTPALAFHAQERCVPGIMVTGSHIPFDRNGIKFYRADGEITKADEAKISAAVVDVPLGAQTVALPSINRNAYDAYVARYVDFFPPRCFAGMRLGFYEHSSLAREVLKSILSALGAEVISLGRTDEFVPIDTEAVSKADIEQARRWAAQHRFDAIVSTDGDADRPLLGDENGDWFRGDVVGILSAQYLRAQGVVTTVSSNSAVELCGKFEQVIRTRIGSPYVIEGIEKLITAGVTQVVGFEPNGGFLVGSPIERDGRTLAPLMTRDAVLPMLCVLHMARERGVKVSALPGLLPTRFTASDRIQSFPTALSKKLIGEFAESPEAFAALFGSICGSAKRQDQTDGLRIYLESDEIVHFRPSGNAPELRCYAEAGDQARAEQLVAECLQRLKGQLKVE
ncbi:phosphomannomutase [Niveibacterium umoris]|uniref:Phosphomannomutase n=1 Tax=Niveibacterium umoris TaxID=1193620 RepID=A0A840BM82_9RHOO|nr:phosphomannomutase [Niveibacterium umoris]MBB4011597.1 phosphomannomutase [Niveibacterium umoris]